MTFGPTPTDGSISPIPMPTVIPDGSTTPTALEGGPAISSAGNSLSPVSIYVKDGNDLTKGVTTDIAVTGDVGGTLSAKVRGLSKMWADMWDSVGHRLKVDGSGVTQPVSGAISVSNFPGTQPVSGTVTANAGINLNTSLLALETGGNLASLVTNTADLLADGDHLATIDTSTANVSTATGPKTDSKATDGSTTAWSVIALLKGIIDKLLSTLAVTQSGAWTVQPGNTANTTPWLTSPQVASSGGAIPYHTLSAATTNFTNVKVSACQIYGCDLSNTSGATIFVKFYDKATTPGTGDIPKRTYQVPANSTLLRVFPNGLKFTSGFGWAATGAVGDADNTAIAANCVIDFDLNS